MKQNVFQTASTSGFRGAGGHSAAFVSHFLEAGTMESQKETREFGLSWKVLYILRHLTYSDTSDNFSFRKN